ncbi:hypothetical protein DPEC_G00046830 [Dallia pectoralis]|uniref:Uncharacterized protein n=1 Tax=Dallia pectoralis TaxID=75939 RepID=A0ACC2HA33_DALPE|nr:hypothetical protein DPEC_G00046830 [Dallia pectoralis]
MSHLRRSNILFHAGCVLNTWVSAALHKDAIMQIARPFPLLCIFPQSTPLIKNEQGEEQNGPSSTCQGFNEPRISACGREGNTKVQNVKDSGLHIVGSSPRGCLRRSVSRGYQAGCLSHLESSLPLPHRNTNEWG